MKKHDTHKPDAKNAPHNKREYEIPGSLIEPKPLYGREEESMLFPDDLLSPNTPASEYQQEEE